MKKSVVQGLVAVAGFAAAASSVLAQAPSSAQVWDVRFVVDQSGPYAEGAFATQVGITVYARVGILPNGSASGTANLGVSRVGGSGTATSGFRMVFTDAFSGGLGLGQGEVSQGNTADIDGRALSDTNGNPLTGSFAPFRGSFSPQAFPAFLGSNADPSNGNTSNPATGSPSLFNVIGGRQFNFGSEGTGAHGNAATAVDSNPANLIGDLVPVYRLYYVPREDGSNPLGRLITVTVSGIQARYIYGLQGTNGQSGGTVNLPGQTFTFRVPTPGAAALAGLAMVAGLRRRRA
ncbi:MAG: hypothetical protein AB7K52_00335 [Phycisphaerales bacterium]